MVNIYTDGACSGNPGPGGYGAILTFKEKRKELSGGFKLTTNNRMELLACIVALEQLKNEGTEVTIWSDSKYVCDAINKGWLLDWINKRFKGKKNPDLWVQFYSLYTKHKVKMQWIKGHAGHPMNERCDELAVAASRGGNLQTDRFFEENKE
ncbi:MAG: ribonuclease HI [Bacteroidota bacterium]|nr:ribonuclease HI [Bacteroidota bacterium]